MSAERHDGGAGCRKALEYLGAYLVIRAHRGWTGPLDDEDVEDARGCALAVGVDHAEAAAFDRLDPQRACEAARAEFRLAVLGIGTA